jgi:hypothetical protein
MLCLCSKVHFKTGWMPVSRKMGSSPSSPTRDVSEKFWVPPAVLERKRAQSLVPTVPHHDSDDGKFFLLFSFFFFTNVIKFYFYCSFPHVKLMAIYIYMPIVIRFR